MGKYALIVVLALVLALELAAISGVAADEWPEPYESYFLFLGYDYPSGNEMGWQENAQGVTHDENYWYITQAHDGYPNEQALWKIPVEHDLRSIHPLQDVKVIHIGNVPELANYGYWHFGDLSYYNFAGEGYLIIPVEGPDPLDAISIFKADDLSYVAHWDVHDLQKDTPWCGVDSSGYLYSSDFENVFNIKKYELNWAQLKEEQSPELKHVGNISLLDQNGSPLTLQEIQGGVFSPSGHLLYLVTQESGGIHVFDTQSWRRIVKSTNGYGLFNFQFGGTWTLGQEPEGITIWDLDNGRAPGITGQLHVLLLNHEWPDADIIYFKHYTNIIEVDSAYHGEEHGTPDKPFTTIRGAQKWLQCISWLECPSYCPWSDYWLPSEGSLPEGVWCRWADDPPMIECFDGQGNPWYPDLYKCYLCLHPWEVSDPTECFGWDGARIKIRAGTYPETYPGALVFDKQIQLLADGGRACIRGKVALWPGGSINLGRDGELKIY